MNTVKDISESIKSKSRRKAKTDELFNVMDTASDDELLGMMDEINKGQYKTEIDQSKNEI